MINPRIAQNLRSQSRNQQSPFESVANTVGSEFLKTGGDFVNTAKQRVEDFVQDTGFGKALRAFGLFADAVPKEVSLKDGNWSSSSSSGDWRVKLSLPQNWGQLYSLKTTIGNHLHSGSFELTSLSNLFGQDIFQVR